MLAPLLSLILLAPAASGHSSEGFRFESSVAALEIDGNGRCTALAVHGSDLWLGPLPFSSVTFGTTTTPCTSFRAQGAEYLVGYGATGARARFSIEARSEAIVFRLLSLDGARPDAVRLLQIETRATTRRGSVLNTRWNDRVAVAVLGLDDRVECAPWGASGLAATAHDWLGLEGRGAAIVAGPTETFRQRIRTAELALGLPSPDIGGDWAKVSGPSNQSYLFTDLTAANVGTTIRLAKKGGFGAILVYGSTWSASSGTYGVNLGNYPGGEQSLKETIDRCHAAGLRVGMHVGTSMIAKSDPLVRPIPDPRLLQDETAILAQDVDPSATVLLLEGDLTRFPVDGAFYGNFKSGTDVLIGSEIVHYEQIDAPGKRLLRCTRGWAGTKPSAHEAGTRVGHLAERYNAYLADLKTDLLDQIAQRLAGLIDRCGFDMIYFDGGENASANGPYWYWIGRLQTEVLRRCRRELVVQGSGISHWTWHYFTRGTCDDYAALAPDVYLDRHKIADSYRAYESDFLPAELGWWGLLASTPQWRATLSDDVDAYGARMVALDAPVGLETTLSDIEANPRSEEILARLAAWESLRLSGTVPAETRAAMQSGRWTLDERDRPVPIQRIDSTLESGSEGGPIVADAGRIESIRLEALPLLASPDSDGARELAGDQSVPVPPPNAPMPGWLALRLPASATGGGFAPVPANARVAGAQRASSLDLTSRRTLALTVGAQGSGGVLNVQLESPGKLYRDYIVDVRPGTTTTILEPLRAERMLQEFRPAYSNYSYKAALYAFDYRTVTAINIRWMRPPAAGASVRLVSVEALQEFARAVSRPTLVLGGTRVVLPISLRTGESVEIGRDGGAVVFDESGRPRANLDLGALPRLETGAKIALASNGPGRARLTVSIRAGL